MMKSFRSIALTSALILIAANGLSPAIAQYVPGRTTLGICESEVLSGRSVVDSAGNVVRLVDYCREQRTASLAVGIEGDRFWQNYVTVASPTALDFTRTIDPQLLIDYGTSVCPFLAGGGSMQEIRLLQRDGALPSSVEVAVTVAAIHTYCPEFASRIGRR
ncbi:DUF732 domain-containing protein [Oculatella sp. LEGE 06141]|uniref:DUF732 domain-containing protein n=1 Tax=Oculatella sp. LEGE 06141 TaxID=1828648 RepID=UPI00187F3048|nr:DUF732 domain-containing protein [Oculatella sp. LEGE 06141]MBE9179905.1 DUF732 domain-containing protein [Oculatella sp. LEGE 06141]